MGIFSTEDLDRAFGNIPVPEPAPAPNEELTTAEQPGDFDDYYRGQPITEANVPPVPIDYSAVRNEEQSTWRGRSGNVLPARLGGLSRNQKWGVAVVLAGSLVGGLFVGQTRSHESPSGSNSLPSNEIPGVTSGQQGGEAVAPNTQPKEPGSATFIPPKDIKLSFIGFGPENQGYRQLGTYATKPALFNFESNGHTFTVNAPATEVNLLTGGNAIQSIVNNNGVDTELNTWKKLAMINQDSFDFKASFPTSDFVDKGLLITTVLPAQQLAASGAGYTVAKACAAFPKLVGCPGVKIPSSYELSTQQTRRYKAAAAIDMLLSVQKTCASQEIKNEKKAIDYAYDGQAKNQGIDPSPGLITEEYVNSKGKPATATPNYVGRLIDLLLKDGGFRNVAAASKLFAGQPSIISTCQPDNIKPAA